MALPLPITDHKKGLSLSAAGGLLIACDVPLIRLAGSDAWSVLLLRGPLLFLALLCTHLILSRMKFASPPFFTGWDTIILGAIEAIAMVSFVLGIYHTTTANLVFITAFSALIAIVFARLVLKEHHPALTWFSLLLALFGIGLITYEDFSLNQGRHLFGNMMALLCALMLAASVIFIRRSHNNLVYAPATAALMAAACALPFVMHNGIMLDNFSYLLINALIVVPASSALLALAPRYISAPEAAMFYLLETVLAPLIVWVLFDEAVTHNTLIGGAIVVFAILFHCYIKLRPPAFRPGPSEQRQI